MPLPNYYAKAISGQPIKNDSSTLLNAGNVNSVLANNVTLAENMSNANYYGSNIVKSTSPTASGNVGIGVAISNGTVNVNGEGNYIAIMLGQKIANISSTALRNSASDVGQRGLTNHFYGYRRLHETGWDYETGDVTKGGEAGTLVQASGISGTVGKGADDSIKYPGEFTSMQGGANPTQDDYNT